MLIENDLRLQISTIEHNIKGVIKNKQQVSNRAYQKTNLVFVNCLLNTVFLKGKMYLYK